MKSTQCRGCGSNDLKTIVDFGPQPLAGYFPLEPESTRPAPRYPLDLSRCDACGLLQVTHLPPIEQVFHADYRYSSSTIPGLVRHFDQYGRWLHERMDLGSRVLEFGCNDGVLLRVLRDLGHRVTGVDASENVAQLARDRGLDVHTGFFTRDLVAQRAWTSTFDVVTCSNVFAHIHLVRATAAAARDALRMGGRFCVEVHNARSLATEHQFDTVYHEHLTYFDEHTLADLLRREGFEPEEVAQTAMHGDGLRLRARKVLDTDRPIPPTSRDSGEVDRLAAMTVTIARCAEQVRELRRAHGPLAAFGAAGRSQMFVNMTGTADCFAEVYDDSPLRIGRFIAATNVPIRRYEGQSGSCCMILAWNYADDIAARLRGRFDHVVTLLPQLRQW